MLDELADAVAGAVDRSGDDREEVLVLRLLVEPAQLLDRRARRDVAARRSAHAVADGEQPRARIARVLVVLADPADIGDGGVVQAQARRRVVGRTVDGRAVGHGLLPQLEDGLADPDLGAEGQGRGLRDAGAADIGAVGGAEVLDEPLVLGRGDARLASRPGIP